MTQCLSPPVYHMTPVICHVSHVTCQVLDVTCHVSHVTSNYQTVRARELKPVTCLMSCVMCHLLRVTCHLSHVTYCFLVFFLQSVEAIWRRVCYQRGQPRLVCIPMKVMVNFVDLGYAWLLLFVNLESS